MSEANADKLPDNELHEDIRLPNPLSIAFMSDRPELARLWKGPMDAECAQAVAHAMAVVMERNRQLRAKLAAMRQCIEDGLPTVRGALNAMALRISEIDTDASPAIVERDRREGGEAR